VLSSTVVQRRLQRRAEEGVGVERGRDQDMTGVQARQGVALEGSFKRYVGRDAIVAKMLS
jgi:hypothetical protein